MFSFKSLYAIEKNNEILKNKILKNVRCLICQGQSVYDSQSDFAISMKLVIDQKIIEGLLESVVEHQSAMAILDMTAVPTFDTHVANNILKTIVAAKMVGTQVILSGISTNAALTIVKLGVDLSHVETFNTLENAIAYGYNKTHTKITQE